MALGLLAFSSAAAAQISVWQPDNAGAETKAICQRVGSPRPPAADRPTAEQAQALRGCRSELLYYGEGVKPDYAQARRCAFVEEQINDGTVFGGKTILMQLYANGLGVKSDPDLATAYACELDGDAYDRGNRIAHLQSLKTRPSHSFDYCDDSTDGMAAGYCLLRYSNQAAFDRDARIAALVGKLPDAARPLYALMRKSFDAFAEAHGGEVNQSAMDGLMVVVTELEATRGQFEADLRRLTSGRWLPASAVDAGKADARLNASYRKALAYAAAADDVSTIKPDTIRKAQRAWLVYRDAYLRFAGAVPGVSKDAVLARLTRLRTADLNRIVKG